VLKEARKTKEPIFITQRGRATAVLLSLEAYERSEAERELLLTLARGEREIAKGKGYSLESVLAEADELLADG
jgi:prevent-host-death family protein